MEYYLLRCVPADQQPVGFQGAAHRQQQMRRLQGKELDLSVSTSSKNVQGKKVQSDQYTRVPKHGRTRMFTLNVLPITCIADPSWTQQGGGDIDGVGEELEEVAHGVTRNDLDLLKKTAPSAINELLLKKVLDINQVGDFEWAHGFH
jgi:hypothetical protein